MQYCVVKTGAEIFDVIHACGLGIVLACASESTIELVDEGVAYLLSEPTGVRLNDTVSILNRVLALPRPEEIEAAEKRYTDAPVNVATLDGLSAALFTTPGARAASVADALNKRRFQPEILQDALRKAQRAIARLRLYAERTSCHAHCEWLPHLLQDYDAGQPQVPVPVAKAKHDIAVPMTLDPAFSHSTRRPISDGLVGDKTNVTIRGTRYAALLAFVGASRFLRAQRVAGDLVNFYIPVVRSMTLHPDTSLPVLPPTEHPAGHAAVSRWLAYQKMAQSQDSHWRGLAYQVMQTQGAQQSISRDRGFLENLWLDTVEARTGSGMIAYWRWLLGRHREETPFEVDNLVDCLAEHDATAWLGHLRDVALHLHADPQAKTRPYSLAEVKEVTAMMVAPTHLPLSAVLDRKQGTLRFGHALRQLGEQNPAPLRELVEALDAVRTRDQLVRVLARAVQECVVARATSKFKLTIPNDKDLRCLLDDVDQYGAATIAGLLVILSALYYPYRSNTRATDKTFKPEEPVLEGGEDDH